jgi:DNA modification methylase
MEVNKVYQGDSAEMMKQLPDNFIDLTVTSPPNIGNVLNAIKLPVIQEE